MGRDQIPALVHTSLFFIQRPFIQGLNAVKTGLKRATQSLARMLVVLFLMLPGTRKDTDVIFKQMCQESNNWLHLTLIIWHKNHSAQNYCALSSISHTPITPHMNKALKYAHFFIDYIIKSQLVIFPLASIRCFYLSWLIYKLEKCTQRKWWFAGWFKGIQYNKC